jgi:hypothetical protein
MGEAPPSLPPKLSPSGRSHTPTGPQLGSAGQGGRLGLGGASIALGQAVVLSCKRSACVSR